MAVEIRALGDADIDGVVEFSVRAWAPAFESFRRVLGGGIFERVYPDWRESQARAVARVCREHLGSSWVADVGGRPVGFVVVVLEPAGRSAEIDMLAVDPEFQRRGIAGALMEFVLGWLRAAGVGLVSVGTGGDPGHAPARRAYESAGFTALPLVRYYKVLEA